MIFPLEKNKFLSAFVRELLAEISSLSRSASSLLDRALLSLIFMLLLVLGSKAVNTKSTPVLILKTLEYLDFDIKVKGFCPRGLWRHRPSHCGSYLLRLLTDGCRSRTINSCHSLCWRLNGRIMIKRLLSGILNKSIKTSGGSCDPILLCFSSWRRWTLLSSCSNLPPSWQNSSFCLFSFVSPHCHRATMNRQSAQSWFFTIQTKLGADLVMTAISVLQLCGCRHVKLEAATSTRRTVVLVSAQILTISYVYFSACKWGKGANQSGLFERLCKCSEAVEQTPDLPLKLCHFHKPKKCGKLLSAAQESWCENSRKWTNPAKT